MIIKKKTEEDQSYFVHEFAHKWFEKQLWETNEGVSVGLSYFHERGLSDAVIKNSDSAIRQTIIQHLPIMR